MSYYTVFGLIFVFNSTDGTAMACVNEFDCYMGKNRVGIERSLTITNIQAIADPRLHHDLYGN